MESGAGGGKGPPIPAALLLAAVACSGAAVMVVEMTAVRALQPHFGSTTLVWAHVIAVVLAALALGSWHGGRWADRAPRPGLLFGLLGGGGLLVAAAAAASGPVARLFLAEGLDMEGLASALSRGALGTTLLLFAPPLYLLGAVTPLAVRLLAAGGVGRAAGSVYALSTLGALAGTYLPHLVLVPAFGTRGALLCGALLLLGPAAAGAILLARGRRAAAALLLLAAGPAAALAAGGPIRPAPPLPGGGVATILEERESPYQYLAVREDRVPGEPPVRVLAINEGVYTFHALAAEGRVLAGSRYYDDAAWLPLLLDLPEGAELRVGIVGWACGVNARLLRHFWEGPYRVRLSGAEIDPEVLDLGRTRFGDAEGGGAVAADGRPWLAALPPGERFDLLCVDAFAQELYVPFHLATEEFFALCRERLAPGGILAMAVWGIGAEAPHVAAVEGTLAAVFGGVLRSPRYGGAGFLLLARRGDGPPDAGLLAPGSVHARFGPREGTEAWDRLREIAADAGRDAIPVRPRPGAAILTDDRAPLEFLTDRAFAAEERRVREGRAGPGAGTVADRGRAARALALRQDLALALLATAWAAVAAAGARRP